MTRMKYRRMLCLPHILDGPRMASITGIPANFLFEVQEVIHETLGR